MKKNKFDKKSVFLGIGLTISTIVLVLFLAYRMYCYFKGEKIDDISGYNSINAVVAVMALIMNILTVIFVFATYQTQRNQIEDNKKDGEFNRVLDIIYKQLDYTINRFDAEYPSINSKYGWTLRGKYNYSIKRIRVDEIPVIVNDPETFQLYDYNKVFSFFSKELEVYSKIINTNNHLSKDDKDFFTKLFADNIDSSLITQIGIFQNLYTAMKNSEGYEVLKKLKSNIDLNSLEFDLNQVLGYLRIEKIEGLDLGE